MNYINLLLTFIGTLSTTMCVIFFLNKATEFWFELQACKRDIERLERQIKNLQCNRLP